MIDGPAKQPELGDFFETVQHFDAKLTAEESGMAYFSADNFDNFTENLSKFMNLTEKSALFEVKTSPEINTKVFKQFKSTFDN
jgi:2-succinyl-5-enolpyruvyl-6-hydroxy-3-cyclohexene-1-carboxylate synthase